MGEDSIKHRLKVLTRIRIRCAGALEAKRRDAENVVVVRPRLCGVRKIGCHAVGRRRSRRAFRITDSVS